MNYRVSISGQRDLPELSAETAAIVALEPGTFDHSMNSRLAEQSALLRLEMDDAWTPEDYDGGFQFAQPWQVESALKFVQTFRDSPLHVACYAGVSRSTALSLLALWDRRPKGADEHDVLAELNRVRPGAMPNPHIVLLVDALLGTAFLEVLASLPRREVL